MYFKVWRPLKSDIWLERLEDNEISDVELFRPVHVL